MGICLYSLKMIQSRVQSACLSLKRTKPYKWELSLCERRTELGLHPMDIKKEKEKGIKRDYLQKIHAVRFNDQRTTISMASIKDI